MRDKSMMLYRLHMDRLAKMWTKAPSLCKHRRQGKEMHTPYAGIILIRFKGTFSARPAFIFGQTARADDADTDTPGAFLMSIGD